jgi:orotidine-5'-phosphate decarboxylase
VEKLAALGPGIFLDLKFHDIPNTVASAVAVAADLPKVRMLTLHTLGDLPMMRAARDAIAGKKRPPLLLGVTILTSMESASLRRVGISGSLGSRVLSLARLAKDAQLDGVVASSHEAQAIRRACGPDFLIVVPGVRPANASLNDQARVATPAEAIEAGANFLVVGRPITQGAHPREAALAIAREIASARSGR